jgi:uncharacterized protein (DUF1697 family)
MVRYVALLRGINVSGQKIIKMELLKQIFEKLGFENVKTYIQSGNVIFDSKITDLHFLSEKIEKQLLISLGYNITVFIRSLSELKDIIENNPFKSSDRIDHNTSMYVSFLSEMPNEAAKEKLFLTNNNIELFNIRNREVYCLRLIKNDGKTKYNLYSLEKIIGMPATTRNITTINKLLTFME